MFERNLPVSRRRLLTRGALIFACGVLLIGIVPSALGAKTEFRPGLYVGKTSQGEAVRLKVDGCGAGQCLEAPNEQAYFSIDLSCQASGQTEEQIVDLESIAIPKSGAVVLHGASPPGATDDKSTEKIKVARNGTLTGRFNVSETLETGTVCTSGNVTLRAKIGGTTK